MKLVLFDIDGTLLATQGAGNRALIAATEDVLGVREDLGRVTVAGHTDISNAQQILNKHSIPVTDRSIHQLLGAYLARLRDSLAENPGVILPGIVPLLDRLTEKQDVRLGLLTGNLVRGAHLKLATHGLEKHFVVGAFGDDHHDRNELGPIVKKRAENHFKTEFTPSDIYVLGDTPKDVACGKAFGAKTVAVATGSYNRDQLAAESPDFVFENFSNTQEVLNCFGLS
jgi:phosphoglycolate phosphatase